MINDTVEIDWEYLLERLDRMLDLGEEYLTRQLALYELETGLFQEYIALRWRSRGEGGVLEGVAFPDLPDHADLLGIDGALRRLHRNTEQFVRGLPANNVLLWGERGSGKSSAVKSLLPVFAKRGLRLIEVQKDDLYQLPRITALLRQQPFRFILFCDDLAFADAEHNYRELKALLEGSLESRAANILVYATSNRRHLLPEHFQDVLADLEIHPEETVAEKISLSDRFGLTIGFYPMDQDTYLAICRHLAAKRNLAIDEPQLTTAALRWALSRGARSGRVARQFMDDLTGRLGLAQREDK